MMMFCVTTAVTVSSASVAILLVVYLRVGCISRVKWCPGLSSSECFAVLHPAALSVRVMGRENWG